jgi:hypothetical protein
MWIQIVGWRYSQR